ncbi:DNA-binding protein [Candidatus Aenigmatarchaeota archaeon]
MTEEDIKKEMLQRKLVEQQQEAQMDEAKKTLKKVVSTLLDEKARQRLSNLRLVKPDVAMQLEMYLAQLYQAGHIKRITEEQLIDILKKITAKHDFKIKRK